MVSLEEFGEKAFGVAFFMSLVITILVITLLASGLPPEAFSIPLFMPASRFYSMVNNIASKIPKNATVEYLTFTTTVSLIGGFWQFSYMLLFGIIGLVQTIATIVPPEVAFLTIPLYFIGSFLQVSIWYYIILKFFNIIRSWLPGG